MPGGYQDGRACCCDPADGSCAGLVVRRLSQRQVHELAEEIWTASTGRVLPAQPLPSPRSSRPGASTRAAYRRLRQQERHAWLRGWWWRAGAALTAAVGCGLLIGLTTGARLGWPMALLAGLLSGWRLRFRPSASTVMWRRQAAAQRRTAAVLKQTEREGYLVLHDVVLPGWPASLDHLVVSATGVWVIESWPRNRLALGRKGTLPPPADGAAITQVRGLHWQAAAIADALGGGPSLLVRPLVCARRRTRRGGQRSVAGIPAVPPRQLPDIIRQGPPLPPGKLHRAAAYALELLRPAL